MADAGDEAVVSTCREAAHRGDWTLALRAARACLQQHRRLYYLRCFEGLALNYCPCGDSCDLDDCDLHYSGAPQIYLKDYAPSGTQNVPYNKSLADAYIADAGRKCAGTVGLDWSAIAACALSDPEDPTSWPATAGSKLEMASATKTAKLQPEHSGVPWVVVDVSPPPAFLRAKTRPPRRGHRSRTRPRSSRPSAPPPRPRASRSRRAATRTPGRRCRRLAALARHMTAPHPIPPGRRPTTPARATRPPKICFLLCVYSPTPPVGTRARTAVAPGA